MQGQFTNPLGNKVSAVAPATSSATVPATPTRVLTGTVDEAGRLTGNKLVPFPGPDHQAQTAAVPASQYKPRRGPVEETQVGVGEFSKLLANVPALPDAKLFPGQDRVSLDQVADVQEVVDGLGVEEFCKLFIDAHAGENPNYFVIDPNEFFAVASLLLVDNAEEMEEMEVKFHAAQKAMFLQFYRENMARMESKVIARTIGTAWGDEVSSSVLLPIFEKWHAQKKTADVQAAKRKTNEDEPAQKNTRSFHVPMVNTGKFKYTNSMYYEDHPFHPRYENTEQVVGQVTFNISRYGKFTHTILFADMVTEDYAIAAAEAFLSQLLDEKYYKRICKDLFGGGCDNFADAKDAYRCRGECLSDCQFLESAELDEASGELVLSCGS